MTPSDLTKMKHACQHIMPGAHLHRDYVLRTCVMQIQLVLHFQKCVPHTKKHVSIFYVSFLNLLG